MTVCDINQIILLDEDEIIGDHTKRYCLPIEKSASPFDLKCISPQTVSHCYHGDDVMTMHRWLMCCQASMIKCSTHSLSLTVDTLMSTVGVTLRCILMF